MEKFPWKKELYFVRYLISKFRDFSRIFSEFFRDISDFEHIYENVTLIFEIEIYSNAPPILEMKIYKNTLPIFKVKIYINDPLIFEVRNLQKCNSARSQSKARISLN